MRTASDGGGGAEGEEVVHPLTRSTTSHDGAACALPPASAFVALLPPPPPPCLPGASCGASSRGISRLRQVSTRTRGVQRVHVSVYMCVRVSVYRTLCDSFVVFFLLLCACCGCVRVLCAFAIPTLLVLCQVRPSASTRAVVRGVVSSRLVSRLLLFVCCGLCEPHAPSPPPLTGGFVQLLFLGVSSLRSARSIPVLWTRAQRRWCR